MDVHAKTYNLTLDFGHIMKAPLLSLLVFASTAALAQSKEEVIDTSKKTAVTSTSSSTPNYDGLTPRQMYQLRKAKERMVTAEVAASMKPDAEVKKIQNIGDSPNDIVAPESFVDNVKNIGDHPYDTLVPDQEPVTKGTGNNIGDTPDDVEVSDTDITKALAYKPKPVIKKAPTAVAVVPAVPAPPVMKKVPVAPVSVPAVTAAKRPVAEPPPAKPKDIKAETKVKPTTKQNTAKPPVVTSSAPAAPVFPPAPKAEPSILDWLLGK